MSDFEEFEKQLNENRQGTVKTYPRCSCAVIGQCIKQVPLMSLMHITTTMMNNEYMMQTVLIQAFLKTPHKYSHFILIYLYI